METEVPDPKERVDAASCPTVAPSAKDVFGELLTRTSRTFALAIPCLPDSIRHEVTVAYLLFRIADTIEDGPHLNRDEKLSALNQLEMLLLGRPGRQAVLTLPRSPCDNADYLTLLGACPLVFDQLQTFEPVIRTCILRGVRKSLGGMRQFIAAGDASGRIEIGSLAGLRHYCYFVAGLVGEMLTELFAYAAPGLQQIRPRLMRRSRFFGEGLQLVNILKDSLDDQRTGQSFEPRDTPRVQLIRLARQDLSQARAYVNALRRAKAPAGIIAFTLLPLRLAWRTLEFVELSGPGSKVPRLEVLQILTETLAEAGLSRAELSTVQKGFHSEDLPCKVVIP
jgi:farnesyl-diphosphate farnesyltransferase